MIIKLVWLAIKIRLYIIIISTVVNAIFKIAGRHLYDLPMKVR